MPPNIKDTSRARAVVIPPSCVNTTHPIVQNKNIKVPMYSAITACLKSVVDISSFQCGKPLKEAGAREETQGRKKKSRQWGVVWKVRA